MERIDFEKQGTSVSREEVINNLPWDKLDSWTKEEIELSGYDWKIYRWSSGEPLIIAQNGYDLREANVVIEAFGLKLVKQIDCLGGNFARIYNKKSDSNPGYLLMMNHEEGGRLIILK